MADYKGREIDPPLPPLSVRHVYDWLMEIGPVDNGAMGPIPLGWSTIRDWAEGAFQQMSAWEFRMLRRLSTVYLTELHAAEDRNCPAPWSPRRADVDRKSEEQQLRSVLG